MSRALTAAEANRTFSAVLREVRAGRSFVVTSHGRPVARIVPFTPGDQVRRTARSTLFGRLKAAPAIHAGRWTRDELHER